MRAHRWKHILAIPCGLVLVGILAGSAAIGTRYVQYCHKYGFVRFTRALIVEVVR